MRSTYWNMIPLQPQYVRTILRWFDADSVHMLNGRGGQKYVVDLVNNLTSWVEAHTLQRLKADKIADFLFDVMCRFSCIFQLMCDNGTEFKGATEELMRKYKVPVVRISPYNSQVNGKSKECRGHTWKQFGKLYKETWPSGHYGWDMLYGLIE